MIIYTDFITFGDNHNSNSTELILNNLKKELSRKLHKNGIVYSIVRGAIKLKEIPIFLKDTPIDLVGGNHFELIEHDVVMSNVPARFPYHYDMDQIKRLYTNINYRFIAFYYCNDFSHGFCKQMKNILSDENTVIEVFDNRDLAEEWLKRMMYTVGL